MPYTILSNKKNLAATLHFTGANSTVIVAGNTTNSNVATGNETLTGGVITQLYWGVDTGSVQILRGANIVATLTQSGSKDFAASGLALTKDQSANVNVNFVGTANGYVLMELVKTGTFISEYLG